MTNLEARRIACVLVHAIGEDKLNEDNEKALAFLCAHFAREWPKLSWAQQFQAAVQAAKLLQAERNRPAPGEPPPNV